MVNEVVVRINSGHKTYSFKNSIIGLCKGDMVVVDAGGSFAIAEVVDVHSTVSSASRKWVVQKVDVTGHALRIQYDARIAILEKQLKDRINTLTAGYDMTQFIVRTDKTAEELYEELERLRKGL